MKPTVSRFDVATLRQMRVDMDAALAAVGAKYDVVIQTGAASYTESTVTFKVQALARAADGSVISREAEYFKQIASVYGMEPSDLGREFACHGNTYAVAGFLAKARLTPIVARRADGKMFKFAVADVVRMLAAAKAKGGSA